MTEQSKIPVPGQPEKGKSLLERADGAFGFEGLMAAPVPERLPEPATRRSPQSRKRPPELRASSETPEVPTSPVVDVQPGAVRPAPSSLEKVEFTGRPQTIDRARLRANGLIDPDGDVTTLLEEFRIVKRQILLAAREAVEAGRGPAAQRVLVCSPLPGEGKTFCAVNLALAIAFEKDVEVVLADADFANPSVLSLLGLTGDKGLMDAFADPTVRIEDCVIPTDVPGLFVLPAGNRTSSDSEYLAAERTSEILDRLTRDAPRRLVIFDSPPALAASPAAELAHHVGQALLICRADQTGQSALEDALSLLSACPDIKLLLNSAHFSPSGRRFGAYYGYGS